MEASAIIIKWGKALYTQRDLQVRRSYMGLDISPDSIFTSALATAQFLQAQRPGGQAFTLGESGLTTALPGLRIPSRMLSFDPASLLEDTK